MNIFTISLGPLGPVTEAREKRSGELRERMPTVAAWIDDLRAAFGHEAIDEPMRRGIRGKPTFHATEAGHQVGTEVEHAEK